MNSTELNVTQNGINKTGHERTHGYFVSSRMFATIVVLLSNDVTLTDRSQNHVECIVYITE